MSIELQMEKVSWSRLRQFVKPRAGWLIARVAADVVEDKMGLAIEANSRLKNWLLDIQALSLTVLRNRPRLLNISKWFLLYTSLQDATERLQHLTFQALEILSFSHS
jgi:hypothetical protein